MVIAHFFEKKIDDVIAIKIFRLISLPVTITKNRSVFMENDTELIERGLNFADNGFLKSILSRRVVEISIFIDRSIDQG